MQHYVTCPIAASFRNTKLQVRSGSNLDLSSSRGVISHVIILSVVSGFL